MDGYECIQSKLDIRQFRRGEVTFDIQQKILEAGRLTGSGMNSQHWRFILIRDRKNLKKLAEDSTSGNWVAETSFAIILLTNHRYEFHLIDAGRATQNMQLAAWNFGLISCIFTGIKEESLRIDFNLPRELNASVVIGFGYPEKKLVGNKKNRKPLIEIAFLEKYGIPIIEQK